MERIIYVGMDVHNKSFSMCCMQHELLGDDKVFGQMKLEPNVENVKRYVEKISTELEGAGIKAKFICGYEAGSFGFSLYHQMTEAGLTCVILAPSTMSQRPKHEIKTDKRDAEHIARCLAYGTYKSVHVPTREDEQVRDYLRMRNDHNLALKKLKQQIQALCLRRGMVYTAGSRWTQAHLKWLRTLNFDPLDQEIMNEYLISYDMYATRLEAFQKRIEEYASLDRYRELVKKLCCFIGIKEYSALTLITETGDFARFGKAKQFSKYIGLVPGESSSSERIRRGGITKAGNREMRRIFTEAAHCIARGKVGFKSKDLKARQKGNDAQVVAYADRANVRLRRKYYHLSQRGKNYNLIITSIARELACFVWGMMTEHYDSALAG